MSLNLLVEKGRPLSAEYGNYSPDNNGLAAYHSDQRWYSKRNVGYGPTHAEANYNLTLSQSQLRSPAFQPNDNECLRMFPPIIQKWNNQKEKGEYEEA
jgi:hypothetical protein